VFGIFLNSISENTLGNFYSTFILIIILALITIPITRGIRSQNNPPAGIEDKAA
jgi:hypothetical protein